MNLITEIKILTCETDKESNNKLEKVLSKSRFKNSLLQTASIHLKWMVASHKPDLIITDNNLWEENDAIDLIKELRQANNTPLVIWTNKVSEKIMSAVFNLDHVSFIKKTADETLLMETILKTIHE